MPLQHVRGALHPVRTFTTPRHSTAIASHHEGPSISRQEVLHPCRHVPPTQLRLNRKKAPLQVDNMFAPNHWESYCSERSRNVTAVGLLLVGAHPSPTRIKGHTHPLQHSQAAPMRVTAPPNLELSFPMYPAAFAATAPSQCQNEALNSLSPPLRR